MPSLAVKAPPMRDFPPLLDSPPKFWFGDVVRHKPSREKAEVVGLQWQKTNDSACLDGWYYHLRLINPSPQRFITCHIGGDWAEEMGHERDLLRISK